jgi:6-phosphogluconolactonase
MKPTILKTKSFVQDATDLIVKAANEAIARKGRFTFGLCGGKTPESIYAELAKRADSLNWSKVIITFGDERCVGPDHADSNFRMASESLLKKVPIPLENILRIEGELPPNEAAAKYEKRLLTLFNDQQSEVAHDLLLLGIGDDGHTASLFPGTVALTEDVHLVTANFVRQFNTYRITFTYRLINRSRAVCFLVNDHRKDAVVDEIIRGNQTYPAAKVRPVDELMFVLGT